MSDLIRREDAIKAVAQDLMYESCIQSEYASDELSDWIDVAKVMLEEVPSADRPQEWIPCKERLPREYEVLCCDIYKNCIVGHPFADDSVSTGFCAESEGEFMYECVAWMPLPEPWKGADDE